MGLNQGMQERIPEVDEGGDGREDLCVARKVPEEIRQLRRPRPWQGVAELYPTEI